MKRGTNPARLYRYGVYRTFDAADLALIMPQMRNRHNYLNSLIANEHEKHTTKKAILHSYDPELDGLEAAYLQLEKDVETLRDGIKARNARDRRRTATAEEQAAVAETSRQFKAGKRTYFARLKAAQACPEVSLQLEASYVHYDAEMKRLRKDCDTYWGSYLTAEKQLEQALEMATKNAKEKHIPWRPPGFRHWDQSGKISVGIKNGQTFDAICAGLCRVFRIDPFPAGAFARGAPARLRQGNAYMRVGSTRGKGGDPVWVRVPFIMHRALPPGCLIKRVDLLRRRTGTTFKWFLLFAITSNTGFAADTGDEYDAKGRAYAGAVGIDVGWRRVEEGIRVAVVVDQHGHKEELIIPNAYAGMNAKADSLRSIRDLNFNEAKAKFLAWLREGPAELLPAWLVARTETLASWESQARLASVVIGWRTGYVDREGQAGGGRFPGDEVIFAEMEAWRKQDRHLCEWEAHQRQNFREWRDHYYRNYINRSCRNLAPGEQAGLARRYATAAIENVNWAELRRNPPPESNLTLDQIKHNMDIACVGRFLQLLKEKMPIVSYQAAEYTTQRCHVCQEIELFDKRDLHHTCSHCEAQWDQDENAARLILGLHLGMVAPVA